MDIEAELKSRGWKVVGSVATAAKALEIVENQPIDTAVLDINLGRETSFAVARLCIARGINPVFLSGYGPDALPEDLRGLEVQLKPVRYDALEKALDAATG